MSKKLVFTGYELNVLTDTLTIPGNIRPNRLLLVTDVTNNVIIYNFADPTLGYTNYSFSESQDQTVYNLTADLSALGCTDDDVLQIFIEEDHAKIEFSETMIDPVNKLRVSTPGNLIDTDFEYGLQGTKWETLQTVQNIPTIYSSGGDVPLEGLRSITTTAGSKVVRVLLNQGADIKLGDPVVVQGVTLSLAEGAFLITGVASSTEFYYEIDQVSPRSETISGSYTTVTQAKFFEGSSLLIDESDGLGITTDGVAGASTLTVSTPEVHGLNPRTKIYIRNTIGPKLLTVTSSSATAPDGRPYVDISAALTQSQTIDATLITTRGSYLEFPVVTWDWQSTWNTYLATSDIDTVANTVAWTAHGLLDNYCLVFQTQVRGQTTAGLTDGTVYYVKVVNANVIQLCTDYGTLANVVTLAALDTTKGHPRLGLCYKVEQKQDSTRYTAFFNRNNTVNTNGVTRSFGGQTYRGSQQNFLNDLTSTYGTGQVPWQLSVSRIDYTSNTGLFAGNGLWSYYGDGTPPGRVQQYRVGAAGAGSGTQFPNLDISTSIFQGNGTTYNGVATSAGRYYSGFSLLPDAGLVSTDKFGNPTSNWGITLYWSGQYRPASLNLNHSGSDFATKSYGLSGRAPQRLIAFQSRTPDSAYTTTLDAYSNLPNQRLNGRFGTGSHKYTNNATGTNAFGALITNYVDAGTQVFSGNNTHVYYLMADDIPANFRNSIFKAAHGYATNDLAEVTVNSYSTSNRFSFVDNTGAAVPIASSTFTCRITVITEDLFRIQPTVAPNTDDMTDYPTNFTILVQKINPTYNSMYIANHKITTTTDGTFTTAGTAPAPLVNNTTYRVARLNDNRVFFKNASGAGATAVTAPIGNTSNAAADFNVSFQTPLGINPSSATITKIEYRGDFRQSTEFVVLRFYNSDGTTVNSSFNIGNVAPKAFTASWLTAANWTPKDVSALLRTDGTKGIRVQVDPTSGVNAAPSGMTNWWEIRFTVNASSEDIVLTSQGSGTQNLRLLSQQGAYDGAYPIVDVPATGSGRTFTVAAPFEIPKREYNVVASQVDTANDIITVSPLADHNLLLGEQIEYNNGGQADIIGADARYIIPITSTTFRIANSVQDAFDGNYVQLGSPVGTHKILTSNIIKGLPAVGTVDATVNTKHFAGTSTKFLTDFKKGDDLYTFVGGRMRKFTVDLVLTDTELTVLETVVANVVAQKYFLKTTVNLRPDGYNLHKSFDGGVDITAGTSPNSKIVRQSRKYFRYQSGKGIQNSFAINFSPAKTLAKLTYNATTNLITATTQEVHNLNVNDKITIQNAEVTSGTNFYNSSYIVSAIIDPFTFQVTSGGAMLQSIAAGFPEYFREEWRDSYIRAGMFDDQNGFFFEYDGQDIYCVRRSSTLQLSGVVQTTKGSQVVEGTNTSFTGQLVVGDKISIRGQSYKVVSIQSDTRLVVQPPYRGVNAVQVKITKTVDVRAKRTEWNIDRADGEGPSGYVFNPHKIQMAYADYSWYGAGKIRFGFKDTKGHVFYFHEFIHNNKLNESYFRSGNLPGRYEIENGDDPTSAPTLFHFGTSVIMDGLFSDDGAYKFSAISKPYVYANGTTGTVTATAQSGFEQVTLRGKRVWVYAIPVSQADAAKVVQGQLIRDAGSILPTSTYISQVKVLATGSKVYASYPATAVIPDSGTYLDINTSAVLTYGELSATDLTRPQPLMSIRLAPSVDSSLTGFLGEREIINRMQVILDSVSVTSSKEVDLFLILNGAPSKLTFTSVGTPSLSQYIDHDTGDVVAGGVTLYVGKLTGGTTASFDLAGLIDLGNSILGGDGIFPSGPDLLTLLVQPTSTSGITAASPFIVSGKLSWSESQA
jgi:hypothetical protein